MTNARNVPAAPAAPPRAFAAELRRWADMPSIEVIDYDPIWPDIFDELRRRAWAVVGDFALAIEHVGSTSVPGLAAKPIIDMSVVVESGDDVPRAIERLATLGYLHRGDLGIQGREAFQAPRDLPAHHLYVCPAGSPGLRNHIALRDYLRAHPDVAYPYGVLKKRLAAEFHDNIDGYVAGKTDFIVAILRNTGFSPDALEAIEAVNRNPPGSEPPLPVLVGRPRQPPLATARGMLTAGATILIRLLLLVAGMLLLDRFVHR